MSKVRVWDLPTRVFHWLLVLLVFGLVVSANVGGGAMDWHMRMGYGLLSLLLFRIFWGFVGGHWSRFSNFAASPRTVLLYARTGTAPQQSAGHSPLGAVSVLAMLVVLLLQVGSGLFTDDEIATAGPLARWVSSQWVGMATLYHTKIGKWVVLALVLLHVAAILTYRIVKGQDLVTPMFSGDKDLEFPVTRAADGWWQRLYALGIWMICLVLTIGLLGVA